MKITKECLDDFIDVGLTQTQIANACDISRQAVQQRIAYTPLHGQILRRQFAVPFLRRLGFTIPEIMGFTKYCRGSVWKLLKLTRLSYSDLDYLPKDAVRNVTAMKQFRVGFLHRIGFTTRGIADLTSYKVSTVRAYLYQAGYSLKGRID
jgi:hypothetical protein